MAIRRLGDTSGGLETVASGRRRPVVCRRSTSPTVLLPKDDYPPLIVLDQRDQQVAAGLKARGVVALPWSTTNLIEALAKVGEEP